MGLWHSNIRSDGGNRAIGDRIDGRLESIFFSTSLTPNWLAKESDFKPWNNKGWYTQYP